MMYSITHDVPGLHKQYMQFLHLHYITLALPNNDKGSTIIITTEEARILQNPWRIHVEYIGNTPELGEKSI